MALIDTRVIGKRGGDARAANMTPEQRKEAATKAVTARWDKSKKKRAKAAKKKPKSPSA